MYVLTNGHHSKEKNHLWMEERELVAHGSESGLHGVNSYLGKDAGVSFTNLSTRSSIGEVIQIFYSDCTNYYQVNTIPCKYCHTHSLTASTGFLAYVERITDAYSQWRTNGGQQTELVSQSSCQLLDGLLKVLQKALSDDLTLSVVSFPYSREVASKHC